MHPRLFTTLILLDPVVVAPEKAAETDLFRIARMSTWRRDFWPSQDEARKAFKKSQFYAKWDTRVLDRWLQYGLRRLPTSLYPDSVESDRQVTLKTTKHQEVFTFMRPNFEGYETGQFDRKNHADMDPDLAIEAPFVRPEGLEIFRRLSNVRPSVLYVFGGDSVSSTAPRRKARVDVTGIGVGGSGGTQAGRVKEVILEGIGHLVAMEAVGQCADSAAQWIGTEIKRWIKDEEEFRSMWSKKSLIEKTTINEKWREMLGRPAGNSKL
jgi:hypothetical protein